MKSWLSLDVGYLLVLLGTFAAAAGPLEEHGVVPDVIDAAPKDVVQVEYSSGVSANQGNELTPTQVKDQPTVSWPTEEDALYTLALTDPDAPSRANPKNGEFLHFLVANIPGNDVDLGNPLYGYVGSGPPKGTGLHRYVWLVYKQPGRVEFNIKRISNKSRENRPKFSVRKFAKEYSLGTPIAANFYQAQYDDYVPKLHASLS